MNAWKKVIFVNFFKNYYRIECFEILQIYLCINNEYKVIFSNENIRFSASYSPSPESSNKKFSHCCSDCSLHSVWDKKKPKILWNQNIFPIQWPSIIKKKLKCNQMADYWKKNTKFAEKSYGFWPGKIIFSIQS